MAPTIHPPSPVLVSDDDVDREEAILVSSGEEMLQSPAVSMTPPSYSSSTSNRRWRRRPSRYNIWTTEDELTFVRTIAKLTRENMGVTPQTPVILRALLPDNGPPLLSRGGLDVDVVSCKVAHLKRKLIRRCKRSWKGPRRYHENLLFNACREAFPAEADEGLRVRTATGGIRVYVDPSADDEV